MPFADDVHDDDLDDLAALRQRLDRDATDLRTWLQPHDTLAAMLDQMAPPPTCSQEVLAETEMKIYRELMDEHLDSLLDERGPR